jgi:DNA topoisomerase IA
MPYQLSRLTRTKNGSIVPAEVLKLVQGLYEKKIVTYPRTDTLPLTPITKSPYTFLNDPLSIKRSYYY